MRACATGCGGEGSLRSRGRLPRVGQAVGAALSALALLAGASCGGAGDRPIERSAGPAAARMEKADYVRTFRWSVARFRAAAMETRPDRRTGSLPGQARAARTFSGLLRRLAGDLERLRPPAEVDRAHDAWIRSLKVLSREMGEVARALATGDRRRVASLLDSGLAFDPRNLRAAARAALEFERKGYGLGPELDAVLAPAPVAS